MTFISDPSASCDAVCTTSSTRSLGARIRAAASLVVGFFEAARQNRPRGREDTLRQLDAWDRSPYKEILNRSNTWA